MSEYGFVVCGNTLKSRLTSRQAIISIATQGLDGLTVFDLARAIRANLASDDAIVFWVEAREPFTEGEENRLFDAFVSSVGAPPANRLLFRANEFEELVVVLSLGLLFRWDFWLVSKGPSLVAHHSHDSGLQILSLCEEMRDVLIAMGYLPNTKRAGM